MKFDIMSSLVYSTLQIHKRVNDHELQYRIVCTERVVINTGRLGQMNYLVMSSVLIFVIICDRS